MIFYILGIISLISFLLLVIKYPLRKLGYHKLNAKLMKAHEAASASVFLIGIVQIILCIVKKAAANTVSCIVGLLSYIVDIVIIAACHMTKDVSRKMRDHRVLSLLAAILALLHVILVIVSGFRTKKN